MLWTLLLLTGACSTPVLFEDSVRAPRIIDGVPAAEGAWPSQLSLQRLRPEGWGHTCGATLLNVNYALTAAHCVDGAGPADRVIQAGVNRRSDPDSIGQTRSLSVVTMHPNYVVGSGYPNDIAVLRFSSPISLNERVQPGLLPNAGEDFTQAECIISGWGRTDTSQNIPDDLRQAAITILPHAECVSRLAGSNVIASHICIFDRNSVHGACNGDSGGPINCRHGTGQAWKQVGVASWVRASSGNCLVTYPSVYGRVSSFLDWIEDNTP